MEIGTRFLELYNQYMLPLITYLSEKFSEFRAQVLTPLIDKFMEFFSKLAEATGVVWNTILKPFVLWFMEVAAPIISLFIKNCIDAFFSFFESVQNDHRRYHRCVYRSAGFCYWNCLLETGIGLGKE